MSKGKITVLVENTAGKSGLLGEHGFSALIETPSRKFLFDTGQGMTILHNIQALNIDLKDVDSIVLSHGHYDHTGGLSDVLSVTDTRVVFSHPGVSRQMFSQNTDGTVRENGISHQNREALMKAEWIHVRCCTALGGGVYLTGSIPRQTDFEDTGGRFFSDSGCTDCDDLRDDQALFWCTNQGTVVLSGCSHSGVVNLLRYVRKLTSNRPVYAFIGGMHLTHATQNRIDRTIRAFREFGVQKLYPCHCTGFAATARMWNEFPGGCETCSAGTVIHIGE